MKRLWIWLLLLQLPAAPAAAAIWKVQFTIGFADIYAELDDAQDPAVVLLRVENHSLTQPLKLGQEKSTDLLYMTFDGWWYNWDLQYTGYSFWKKVLGVSPEFVLLADGDQRRMRQIMADELVAKNLKTLRQLLPDQVAEIDRQLGSIDSDYGKQKLIEVYGRLTRLKEQGWQAPWWNQAGHWLAGSRQAGPEDYQRAERLIEEINQIASDYLWPRSLAPGEVVTGVLYFERPVKLPPHLFFQFGEEGDQALGGEMELAIGDGKRK